MALAAAMTWVLAHPGAAAGRYDPPTPALEALHEAQRIDHNDLPYVYGGGHRELPPDPKYTDGYDCSASASRVLFAAGLLRETADSSSFTGYGKPGRGPITVYVHPGHVFLGIEGRHGGERYFGTSEQNPDGGAGFFHPTPEYLAEFQTRRPPR